MIHQSISPFGPSIKPSKVRKSYDLWGLYTPDDEQENDDQLMWQLIHSKNKYVFT
jgi:hypothetical protein